MAFGIENGTSISMQNLTDITNVSSVPELLVNVNNDVYGGWLFFTLMLIFIVILYFAFQQTSNQPLINMMYASGIVSILSILLRGIYVTQNGVLRGLITDFQLWMFPVVTLILVFINWAIRD